MGTMFGRVFARLEEVIIAILLAAMTLLTFLQVVLRYGFNSGLLWALEATTYMFGWLVLIGISYGVRVSAHIGIDMVIKLVPPYARKVAGLAAVALSMVYAALMAYGSYVYIEKLHMIGVEAQDIPVERWLLDIILPIGFGLLFVRLGQVLAGILSGRREGFELADEAGDLLREQGLAARDGEGETTR